ncbi:MAG: DUF3846 domain-containing protein [Ruminococcaceae bacterium]|nr:DUF3846 domain-containing protein [Oscillospiraceae bacterium]
MNVLIVEPGVEPYEAEIDGSLASMQAIVGGRIEAAYPYDDPVAIVCNDEGMMNGMELNRKISSHSVIAGPFFVCGLGKEDFVSLPPDLMEKYKAKFHDAHQFAIINDKVMAFPVPPRPHGPEGDLGQKPKPTKGHDDR